MSRRVLFALAAAAVAIPFQALQAEVLAHAGLVAGRDWAPLVVANLVLLVGAGAVAADFPLAHRSGRALLVGVGVPLLLPGPTVIDSVVHALGPAPDATSLAT